MGSTTSTVVADSATPPHLTLDSAITLLNGRKMPRLGFGVFQIANPVCTSVVASALEVGYRHIDTAQAYRNEAEAGAAMRSTSVKREDIFFVTKIHRDLGSVAANYESVLESVTKINGGDTSSDAYVDLFLIHTPDLENDGVKHVWQALEKLLAEGKTKCIGVSNFEIEHIEAMKEYATVWPPHVNQIQLNPWIQERELVKYCDEKKIGLQAFCPLARAKKLDNPIVGEVAKKHKKTPAQVLIRYCLQKGWAPIPKSAHKERIVENTQVFDFDLSKKEMETLDELDGTEKDLE